MKTYLVLGVCLVPLACLAAEPKGGPTPPDRELAEMMGRVEWSFLHNARDVTARKSIEWGDVEQHENGNRSIRYKFQATIWDREKLTMNMVFTFEPDGTLVDMKHVPGFPKEIAAGRPDATTEQGMIKLVEGFFRNNYRDVTARKSIEWGPVAKDDEGNSSIRYRYEATIWDKETKVMDQLFTFDPTGNFVAVADFREEDSVDPTATQP